MAESWCPGTGCTEVEGFTTRARRTGGIKEESLRAREGSGSLGQGLVTGS